MTGLRNSKRSAAALLVIFGLACCADIAPSLLAVGRAFFALSRNVEAAGREAARSADSFQHSLQSGSPLSPSAPPTRLDCLEPDPARDAAEEDALNQEATMDACEAIQFVLVAPPVNTSFEGENIVISRNVFQPQTAPRSPPFRSERHRCFERCV